MTNERADFHRAKSDVCQIDRNPIMIVPNWNSTCIGFILILRDYITIVQIPMQFFILVNPLVGTERCFERLFDRNILKQTLKNDKIMIITCRIISIHIGA